MKKAPLRPSQGAQVGGSKPRGTKASPEVGGTEDAKQHKASMGARGETAAAKVGAGAYSPPCTRSQRTRFELQKENYQHLPPPRRSSVFPSRYDSLVKSMEELRLGRASLPAFVKKASSDNEEPRLSHDPKKDAKGEFRKPEPPNKKTKGPLAKTQGPNKKAVDPESSKLPEPSKSGKPLMKSPDAKAKNKKGGEGTKEK
ncbi:hypothetical protein HPB48_015242 [Haemaphysalis longicornis]|uniref:Uncharacterized protein n=1 Tax=Haemaphysalis longicornis TaxID=44386 RepID=A0A9J6FIM7_HAELO|nr:hypothetical protein HPB48_015242 [Haemaphysalis longicornis]